MSHCLWHWQSKISKHFKIIFVTKYSLAQVLFLRRKVPYLPPNFPSNFLHTFKLYKRIKPTFFFIPVKVVVNTECKMHEFSKNAFWWQFQWNILPYMMEWRGVSSQISPYFSTWKLSSLTLSHMAKSSICIFRQPRMHKFLKFLPQRDWHLITIIERNEIYGVSRHSKIPYYMQSFCQVWPQGWALSSVQCYLLP